MTAESWKTKCSFGQETRMKTVVGSVSRSNSAMISAQPVNTGPARTWLRLRLRPKREKNRKEGLKCALSLCFKEAEHPYNWMFASSVSEEKRQFQLMACCLQLGESLSTAAQGMALP
ncbi:hypothetical protein MGYG_00044 [Nannizzia gypsea CBS 118893]|uniref:Uncharacterized protein n=1 Tax=Arthroderma gypseum (strain ATCC MYA-4604 / CBS 118893) TaxID=535722 RepID=E5R2B1_ARTGP|nr:hypothetical protein MGYG_00044 [Nannizzia gypsea CBS 118893]EFQ97001.1 hypothetical protein MGYG_00044 [Nannizzia gypsea CBS 118893]